MTGPGSGGRSCNEIARAARRRIGRGVQVTIEDRELDERIQHRQCFVVGDVLLRLRSHQQRKFEPFGNL
jgi:hypothetical protein